MNSRSWGERAGTVVSVCNMHFLVNFRGTLLMILSISVFFFLTQTVVDLGLFKLLLLLLSTVVIFRLRAPLSGLRP